MRKLFPMFVVAILFSSFALYVRAAEEVTVKGEGKCAKCSLKETKKCQTTITTEKDGKKLVYYIKDTPIAKKFHKNICMDDTKTIEAVGTVEKVDGKMVLTASKIEVIEE